MTGWLIAVNDWLTGLASRTRRVIKKALNQINPAGG